MLKKIIIITSIIVAVIIIGVITVYINQRQKGEEVRKEPVAQPEESTIESIIEFIDTSDWRTYRNEEYGFEFKYPPEWFIKVEKGSKYMNGPEAVELLSVKSLNQLDRKNVIMTGIETHICIIQTALHLLPRFGVHVISDAVSSRSLENWRIALQRMRQSGVIVSSTEMVIYELLERAGTEEFRKTLPLVK
jgi:hypothetical protein